LSDSVAERALLAAARCVEHHGLAGTSLEAVAREAGVGRATLYRHFPRGRRQLFDELVTYEVGRFFRDLYGEVAGLTSIEDVLERGLRHAHHALSSHFLLQTVLREDPTVLEPSLSIAMTSIEARVAEVFAPYLPSPHRDERADVLARMSLDYISTAGRWDFDDPTELRALVRDELLGWVGARNVKLAPAHPPALPRVRDSSVRTRVIDATLEEIAAGRLSTFTVEHVARASGASRATVYRTFPGGRDAMIGATAAREASRLFSAAAEAMASAETLQDCLLAGLTTVWAHVASHGAIAGVLQSDPELVRRSLRFDDATRTYFVASSFAQPLLGRWLDPDSAGRIAEWLCRVAVSYALAPAAYLDIADPAQVAAFYGRHLAPGVERLAGGADER
jgi:AcrR family transcriptional regulator